MNVRSVQSEDDGDNGRAIDGAKDGHPNAVNEVPVHFNRLDGEDSLSGEVTTQSTQPANQQEEYTDRDVQTMETGEREEGGAENACLWRKP